MKSRLIKIGLNTLMSGGMVGYGSLDSYIGNAARHALGLSFANFQDGAVHYFGKNVNLLTRGLVQRAHQLAYGLLRSYPRYMTYWEAKIRDKHLKTRSHTSILNESGQYFQLIQDQKAVAEKKSYTDSIVGNMVYDYLELSLSTEGTYFDTKAGKIESNTNYGLVKFVDLQPAVQVSSKNNLVLTTVQGRDYTRKELISGGDMEIAITGKITSKYPEVYPEAEVSKFLKLMQYKGVINCENTILRQFKISQIIIQNYSLGTPEYRNVQPYSLTCVAVEPSEAVDLIAADAERALTKEEIEQMKKAVKRSNKWLRIVNFGTEVVDPSSLLKISRLWI